MRIRTFITAGDELQFIDSCQSCGLRGEIGGTTERDGDIAGFERPDYEKAEFGRRTDWAVVYINCDRLGHAMAVRAQFRHTLGLDA